MSSLKGVMSVKCPAGCPEFEAELWSLIRADLDPDLKDTVIGGELNLLLCPECGKLFYPETPVVYFDPKTEILAFVFPRSFMDNENEWRAKMKSDFEAMKNGLLKEMNIDYDPIVLFGPEHLQSLLLSEQDFIDEADVIEAVAAELGYKTRKIKPSYARFNNTPWVTPYSGDACTEENVVSAIQGMLSDKAEGSRLKHLMDSISSGNKLPPLL